MSKGKNLTYNDRLVIETMLNCDKRVSEIANYLGYHRTTIYKEIKRGLYDHKNSDWTMDKKYSAELGQKMHDYCASNKGCPEKLGHAYKLHDFLEETIIENKYSPEAAIAEMKKSDIEFETEISVRTLYRYIDKGFFANLTNKDLPVKGKKKKRVKKVRIQKKASAGTSIEKRPTEIDNREEFGHWEMDTVKGKKKVTAGCLLVLTERKTRKEIIFKLTDQKSKSVVEALNLLEISWGENFSTIFKTITVDNGVEFSDCAGMEKSVDGENKRTDLYYCHPYSSWERGSNENNNRLVRRHAPKGVDFDGWTDEEIEHIANWMNNYPRRMFDYKTSGELFTEELVNLGIAA